jgi:hypothetical protein
VWYSSRETDRERRPGRGKRERERGDRLPVARSAHSKYNNSQLVRLDPSLSHGALGIVRHCLISWV